MKIELSVEEIKAILSAFKAIISEWNYLSSIEYEIQEKLEKALKEASE